VQHLKYRQMRIRFVGHYLHLPAVTLAVAETSAFCLSMYGSLTLDWWDNPVVLDSTGAVLTRVLVYAAVLAVCYLALGLYTSRQRANAFGVGLRMFIATSATVAAAALVFGLLPGINVGWRT